jgi:diguanylate cyclase (GGDEF)-like protein
MLNTGSLFWIVPAMFALFALSFGVVVYKERTCHAARWAAFGFGAACIGSIVDTQRAHLPHFSSAFATPAHWVCIYCLLQSMLSRKGSSIPIRPLAIWAVIFVSAHVYFVAIAPSITARIILMNVSIPSLMLIGLPTMHRSARQSIDKVLMALIAATAISYPIRLAIFFGQGQVQEVTGPWIWSQYILVFYLVVTVMGVLTALALMLAIGMDMIVKHHESTSADPLTGIGNRRRFDRCIDRDAQGGDLYGAALMIDLDKFKLLNDNHGHAAGDAVLVAVAQALEAKLGNFCDIARIGGEEFAMLVPIESGEGAQSLALMARAVIAAIVPAAPYEQVRITASVGVASRAPHEHLRETLKRADIALYHAKSAGRNRAMQSEFCGGLATIRAVAA